MGKKIDRFYIDKRTGCAAIRDREHPKHVDKSASLNKDMEDVIKFLLGDVTGKGWVMKLSELRYLEELCDLLNQKK